MPKLLHTRIRVSDLEKTALFYETLGFEKGRSVEKSPSGNELLFLEMSGSEHIIELCHSTDYTVAVPEDLMHIAVGYDDLKAVCEQIESAGIEIWPDNWRDKYEEGQRMFFVTDPDGYEVELLERKQ